MKPGKYPDYDYVIGVAPRAGAWIETNFMNLLRKDAPVAPRAGAWIETGESEH